VLWVNQALAPGFSLMNRSATGRWEEFRGRGQALIRHAVDDLEANGSKITVRTVVWGQDTA
jgi:hypothetical protein